MQDYDLVCLQYNVSVSGQAPTGARVDEQYLVEFRPKEPTVDGDDAGGEITVQILSGFLRVPTSAFRDRSPLVAHLAGAAKEAVRRHRIASKA